MTTRITVDPITRIEGHLRIDVEVDDGKVTKAWSSGQMWRGIEKILVGRDPREAWTYTQRFCGVCTTVHAITSVRAVENALQMEVPVNAQLVRNIIQTAHAIQDHIVHFYHLSAVDWVDVVSALDADPAATAKLAESLSDWSGNGVHEMTAVKERLAAFVKTGQLGPFASGFWGHPGMKLPPEVNLMAVAHYLEDTDDTFPFEVHSPPFEVRYIDAKGEMVTRQVIRYDPEVAATRIDHARGEWILVAFTKHFTAEGVLRWFRYCDTDAWVMHARPLYAELKRLAVKGITMYLTRDQWISMNGGDEGIDSW